MSTASTRLVCLLGDPVAHSVSPEIHSAAFAARGVDAAYLAFAVAPDRLATAVAGLRAVGFLGGNVTVPHKQAVLAHVDARTAECGAVGAANTLFWDGDALVADNTDAVGLEAVLRDDVGLRAGQVALVFGAGGAARAAAVALGRLGAAVAVRARRPEAAEQVTALAAAAGAAVADPSARPDLVVNATPLGLHGEPLPTDLMDLARDQTALDLVYGRTATPFLQAAGGAGARAIDGLSMLVAQAAAAFERWTGAPAPVADMRRAAEDALGQA